MATIGRDINYAANLLSSGIPVAIPTETVYGLAANALDANAVARIFEIKRRPFFDPLIVHLPDILAVEKYAHWPSDKLYALANTFWPGSLTILLPKKSIIPDIVTSGLPQVGLRVPDHTVTLQLLHKIDFPLAAPSANPFGYISPTKSVHVDHQLGDQLAYILDGGDCLVGIESTIIGQENGEITVYRLGGLELEKIEEMVGPVNIKLQASNTPTAPGQLSSHYAPSKPVIRIKSRAELNEYVDKKVAFICFGSLERDFHTIRNWTIWNLSEKRNMHEAAAHLFEYLRLADSSAADLILVEPLPDNSLGKAINDRLIRASLK
jgi:L-threonylcarbamoyladenylate synthase